MDGMRSWGSIVWAVVTIVTLVTGCGGTVTQMAADGLVVTVSIAPQKYFVERVGGDRVSVNIMVEPGASPATYEPKPEQIVALSDSVAYFSIGVPFESVWLEKIAAANQEMMIVDTAKGIERVAMAAHLHQDERQSGPPDPHIWLSPRLVKVQIRNICAALVELDPAHESEYTANLETFIADIDALDAEIRETLTGIDNRKFIVFHPSWGYFAHDYGLQMIAVEIGGQEPSAQELADLVEMAREEDIHIIFAQPEFSTRAAEAIADEIDGEVLLISPLAEDWLRNLRHVAETFAEALGDGR